jgi:hypothetical protein
VDWVVTTPCPTKPMAPVREANESDVDWQKKERDHCKVQMARGGWIAYLKIYKLH